MTNSPKLARQQPALSIVDDTISGDSHIFLYFVPSYTSLTLS
ncbi:hypothetical protein DIKCMJMK_02808 [Shewanella oneidensis]|nr:hypothetical protein [Shewanella oneidensis]